MPHVPGSTRRAFLTHSVGATLSVGVAISAGATVAAVGLPPDAALADDSAGVAGRPADTRVVDPRLAEPVDRAYRYLDFVMDAYRADGTLRLLQSYANESGLFTTAFVYDNALAIIAYLARPTAANVRRARLLGDTFLWIQTHDERFADGRVRQAYAAGPMTFYGGAPTFTGVRREDGHAAHLWPFGFSGSSVGDLAWVGLALIRLSAATGQRRYRDGAVRLASWIADRHVSPYRYGGYLGGVGPDGSTGHRWASTEHNIDVYALFRALARATRNRVWHVRAEVARGFVRAMWSPTGRHFFTGTQGSEPTDDPNLINRDPLPEDVNTWSYLSLREHRYAASIDWVARTLATTDRGGVTEHSEVPAGHQLSGVTFSDVSKVLTGPVPNSPRLNNRSAVWLEGNGHLAAALLARHAGRRRDRDWNSDRERAVGYLLQTVSAQCLLGGGQTVGRTSDPDGGKLSDPAGGGTWSGRTPPRRSGIVAATSAFDTGFGFGYFQRLHVGATSWFLIAALGVNPFDV